MPSNLLLLLPLLGGYLFIHLWYRSKIRAQSLEGHRLIFETAIVGFVSVIPARAAIRLLREWGVSGQWWNAASVQTPLLGTLCISVFLCLLAAWLLNFVTGLLHRKKIDPSVKQGTWKWLLALRDVSRDQAFAKAISRSGNDLQRLFHQAATRATKGTAVGITMSDRKLYAGWVLRSANLRPQEQYVSLLPAISGYRDKDSLEVRWLFPYPIARYRADEAAAADYVVTVPISSIASARLLQQQYLMREHRRTAQRRAAAQADTLSTLDPSLGLSTT